MSDLGILAAPCPDGKDLAEMHADLECTLCLKLFYDPATTTCGHTFCKQCLLRCVRHNSKCPICRAALYVNPDRCATNITLAAVLQKAFPQEYAEREQEASNEVASGKAQHTSPSERLYIFHLDTILPRQHIHLNIFEPRYLWMVQRCMEGSRRFGMVGTDHITRTMAGFGTEVEIRLCEQQFNGHILIEVVGVRRFQANDVEMENGCHVANVEWLQDSVPSEEAAPEVERVAGELNTAITQWMGLIVSGRWERQPRQLVKLMEQLGPVPSVSEAEKIGLWVAALINPLPGLGVAPEIRLSALKTLDTLERLKLVLNATKGSIDYMTPSEFAIKMEKVFAHVFQVFVAPVIWLLQRIFQWLFRLHTGGRPVDHTSGT
ncbi:hypothetical protein CYMTET_46418 [Cymbomonas tetramitiformis]|uniref:RING-type domain-containing protein n=1 Tax=Cymbomonas tetramitiformis TaxID=36881 RepID=A0AAE0EXM4_9CHLO|nr:hypothetical protein CYMTET_46418 [Cymbomonas tetramitiformis]